MSKVISLVFLLLVAPSIGNARKALEDLGSLSTRLEQAVLQHDEKNVKIYAEEIANLLLNAETTHQLPQYKNKPLGYSSEESKEIIEHNYGFGSPQDDAVAQVKKALKTLALSGIDLTKISTTPTTSDAVKDHRKAVQQIYDEMKRQVDRDPLKILVEATDRERVLVDPDLKQALDFRDSYYRSAYQGNVYVTNPNLLDQKRISYPDIQRDFPWVTAIEDMLYIPQTIEEFMKDIKDIPAISSWLKINENLGPEKVLMLISWANIKTYSSAAARLYSKIYGHRVPGYTLPEYFDPLDLSSVGSAEVRKEFSQKESQYKYKFHDIPQDEILKTIDQLPTADLAYIAPFNMIAYATLEQRSKDPATQLYLRINRISLDWIKEEAKKYEEQYKFAKSHWNLIQELLDNPKAPQDVKSRINFNKTYLDTGKLLPLDVWIVVPYVQILFDENLLETYEKDTLIKQLLKTTMDILITLREGPFKSDVDSMLEFFFSKHPEQKQGLLKPLADAIQKSFQDVNYSSEWIKEKQKERDLLIPPALHELKKNFTA